MPDITAIEKTPQLDSSQDYKFLRDEGLKYIEELGSSLWTDYNEHDPGITILEALCYAITELGYRAGMPIQNLLTDADGTIPSTQTFYTAKQILTQSPLIANDYRKLLIDIAGVHNAWFFTDDFYTKDKTLIPAGEVALYADCEQDQLSYKATPHQVFISGLYQVLIDLDNDPQFGDLNNGEIVVLTPAVTAVIPARSFRAGAASLTLSLPSWKDADKDILACYYADIDVMSVPVITDDADGSWKIEMTFSCGTNSVTVPGFIHVDLEPADDDITTDDMKSFFTTAFTKQVVQLYALKVQKANRVMQCAIRTLHENRNLCEDFVSVTTVEDEEIAICCDIDVKPAADMEDIQARVFYAIEEYLNPTVTFYTLDELKAKGKTTDEIFEGPALTHGFIDTGELEGTQLRKDIYTSDIINKLMDIDGVVAVRNFLITKYGSDGKPVPGQKSKAWCMPVTLWHKPVFSETKSKIVFYKKQFPYLPSLQEVRDILKWLRALGARNKLNGHAPDIPVPSGSYTQPDDYTSIEYLFPATYGIGKAGLPSGATEKRKAQAKQLKAYLMFYDQLLADFFSQIKNAASLFSVSNMVQTYYAQFLGSIKDIDPIYTKSGTGSLLQELLQHQDATAVPNGWQKLYETPQKFYDRRNRFLDHLMARFAESFNDYVMMMYRLQYDSKTEKKIEPPELISNKIEFLKQYPDISYQRARAFNYYPQDDTKEDDFSVLLSKLWDTDNVSGLEKRLSLLSGIQNYNRRSLYCIPEHSFITTDDTPERFRFVFTNSKGDTLTSTDSYATQSDAEKMLFRFLELVLERDNYAMNQSGNLWNISLTGDNYKELAVSNDFATKGEAKKALDVFTDEFEKNCDATGLYLIEHILLRPRNGQFKPAPVCLNKDCDFCGEQDPYSFRMSIVLPYWPEHFRSLEFRNYFEELARREAPAHAMVRICWINNEAMYEFDNAYKDWLTALANYAADASAIDVLADKNNRMRDLLFALHSEYPQATLHDCKESKNTNPVMLNKTILGSYKS